MPAKKKRTAADRKKSKFFAKKIEDLISGKGQGRGSHNKGKSWGKPLRKGDPRIKKGRDTLREMAKRGAPLQGKLTNELKYHLLKEFIDEQPLVKLRMRQAGVRPADHVRYLDLLGKYSPLGQTINIKTDGDDNAPGKLTKGQVLEQLQAIFNGEA